MPPCAFALAKDIQDGELKYEYSNVMEEKSVNEK
jgi:hypothetical protein